MTEASQINDAVRRHLGPLGLWRRMEHSFDVGWPDWYYRMRRRSGWLEAKLLTGAGLTREQLDWAEEEARWGGLWHALGYHPGKRAWALFDLTGAWRWFEGVAAKEAAVLWTTGPFPQRELIERLAPRP